MSMQLPVLKGFAGYKAPWLGSDITAGLAIAAVAIPSAIAYPAIAGLPPEMGVYASILSLVGYALLGPSCKLIVGPDAATMIVLAAVLDRMAASTQADRAVAAAALAVTVGLFCIVASKLRLGVIAAFLSRPILVGFISGIAISILIGQIGRLTGVRIESDGLFPPLIDTRWFVLDGGSIPQIDSTAAAMLDDVRAGFAERGMALGFAELHKEPMELMKRAGLLERIGTTMIFEDLEDVLPAFKQIGRAS